MEEMIALEKRVRSPIVEGLFYPEDTAGVLAYMRDIGLKRGKGGLARAIIAPHGAWEISGSLVGSAFASAGGKSPSRIVIMGPIHDNKKTGIFLSNSHSFQTPLGDIPVDQEATRWLESYNPLFQVNDIPHLHEHSIEVLLPFVKYCFPDASIVPILMGCPQKQYTDVLAHALRAVFEPVMEDTLLAISFNLAMHPGEEAALKMASECLRLFGEKDYDELCLALQDGRIASCGGALVAALLQSGLVDSARPRISSESLLHAWGEQEKTVYYGAFSFE
ncbi:MAG: AmmeMemoRadiSam system protein B [Treponema sp.]|jgi:AmmeMemoRadiSam system protein B|nr:AmmeMemoRadiSam system protein B [Treponema sp.]